MDNIRNHPLYRRHNIDSAMNSLWEFYKTRFVALFLISLVMSVIIQFGTFLIDLRELQSITDPMEMLSKLKEMIVPLLILMAVSLLLSTMLSHYILHKPLDDSHTIFHSVVKSLKYYLPYIILIVILGFAGIIVIMLGLMVLVIGVFFSIAYLGMISFFILPVMMVEEASIDRTITRSIKLSHSLFWPNMGWTAVFLILYLIISMVLSGLVLLPFAGTFLKTFANPQDTSNIINLTTSPLYLIISSAVSALTMPLFPVFAFIIYFNARAFEENRNISTDSSSPDRVRVEDLYAKPREQEEDRQLNN